MVIISVSLYFMALYLKEIHLQPPLAWRKGAEPIRDRKEADMGPVIPL